MNRSKLELYEDILQALAKRPLSIDAIAFNCDMDCVNLLARLDFLMKNEIVQERAYPRKTVYAITARGLAIYRTLSITHQLEKLQTTAEEFEQRISIPMSSESNEQKNRRSERY